MLGLNMRLVGLLYAAMAWIAPVSGALACPLCFSGLVITPGQKLDSADEAVLAVAIGNGVFRGARTITVDVR